MRQERRRHPRLEIPLEIDLRLAGGEGEVSATMQDLSAGGAGLLTTSEMPVGTEIELLRFELPEGADGVSAIEVAGRVARCEQQEGVGGEDEYLVGVQFVDITRELFDLIQQFVFQHLRAVQKERVQIERPIAIRFDRFDDFVDEVSVNLSTSGMFIRTRDPRPPGSVFNFQFQLGEDFSLIEGRAEVVWRRRQSEGPDKLPGMGVKFLNLDVPSQRLIERLIAQRKEADEAEADWSETAEAEAAASETMEEEQERQPPAEERKPPPDLERAEAAIISLGEVNALRDAAYGLRQELDEARSSHEQELQELRARLEDRQAAATSELEERLRGAESAHRESERQRGELTGELEAARREAEELRHQLAETASTEDLERLVAERDELATAREALQGDLEQTRAEADELRGELERVRGEAGKLEAQLAARASEEEVQRLISDRDAAQATHDRLLADLDRANSEADEMKRQLEDKSLEQELERVTGERDDLKAAYDELQAAHDEVQVARDELESKLDQARDEAVALQAQLDDRNLEEAVERLTVERDSLHATQERLLADVDRANSEADELRLQLADGETRKEIDRLADERGDLLAAHEALQAEHDQGRAARAALEGKLESAQHEIDQLRRSGEATVLQLQADHSTEMERAAAEAREELATAREELDSRTRELAEARERGDALEAELASLREEVERSRAAAAEEAEVAGTEAREEGERLRGELDRALERHLSLESEIQQVRDEARQAALLAEERETALRAEVENAKLAAAGGEPLEAARPRRGRRALAAAALLAMGVLLGLLAVSFIGPLGSLADRLRGTPGPTEVAELPPALASSTPEAEASAQPPAAGDPAETGATIGPGPAEPVPAEPQPPAEPEPDPAAVEQAVLDWAAAWSDQRVDDYLASYADSFQPPDGQSRQAWAANRRQRIERPRSIEVGVEAPRTVELAPDRVSVSFDQRYTSETFSDRVRKTLLFVWQDGAWKIAEERVIE